MAFFDKLKFWKKDDDFSDLDKDFNKGFSNMDTGFSGQDTGFSNQDRYLGLPPSQGVPDVSKYERVGEQPMGPPQQFGQPSINTPSAFSAQPKPMYQEVPPSSNNPELDVISAKLDAIKASLDAINQRLNNLERAAYPEQPKRRDLW